MAFIRVTSNSIATRRKLRIIAKALTPEAQARVLQKVAWVWQSRFVLRTPKRWTGSTRQGWTVVQVQNGYRVVNRMKVMAWLERGTRAHGPKKAKRLFIPLTKRAANAGPRVVVAELQAAARQNRRPKFIIGRDFIFAKRVKGIKGMWIVRDAAPFMRSTVNLALRQFLTIVIRS